LIAVFAVGAPLPVLADCAKCDDCSIAAPAGSDAPCPHKGVACQMIQNCASQVQKVPAQLTVHAAREAAKVTFSQASGAAIKLAQITPEVAPPRL
jgi:hypothetical protein